MTYQEWLRDRPCEARQPTEYFGKVPNPAVHTPKDENFLSPHLLVRALKIFGGKKHEKTIYI